MLHSRRWAITLIAPLTMLGVMAPGLAADAAPTPGVVPQLMADLVKTTNVLPGLDHAVLHGPAVGSTPLTVDIGLSTPGQSTESSLLASLYNPKSAMYHHFLTPAQFDTAFRVPTATVNNAKAWLHSVGLAASYVSGTGDLLSVQGTVAQWGSLLHTTFGDYSIGTYRFIANQSQPSVPAALSITDVVGLNTLERMWPETQLSQNLTASKNAAAAPTAAGSSYVGTDVPQDLWGVYDAPSSDEGQGESVGMFGAGYTNGVIATLRVYEQRVGLPPVPLRVVTESEVTKPAVPNDNDVEGEPEWSNDTQDIAGMAPKLSQLDMYFASTEGDADFATMFSTWADDPLGPRQMSASVGECESDPTSKSALPTASLPFGLALGNQLQILSDHALEQSVLEGRTLFASAGDTGGSCPFVILPVLGSANGIYPQPLATDQGYPCVSVYAVCVGGTVVTTNGTSNPAAAGAATTDFTAHPTRVNEQAWAFTGGGPAANVPKPAYQDGVSAITLPCTQLNQPDGASIPLGTTCRGVPDVAALSGSGLVDGEVVGNNAYLVNIDMMPVGEGGTSVSAPLVAGLWARIQAASPATSKGTYGGLGFANETFYAVGKGEIGDAARDFYDVTSNELPVGNFYEQAKKGWDYTTGWGALDVANFIRDVDRDPSLTPTHPSATVVQPSFFPQAVCTATMTSAVGNAIDSTLSLTSNVNDPQLDITSATLSPSADGKDLVATISGPGLSTTGPLDATSGFNLYMDWTYHGTTYFAAAEVDPPPPLPATPLTNSIPAPVSLPTGKVVYGDGVSGSSSLTITHTDSGSFSNHTFSITVPLANVGNPPAGSLLLYPFAFDSLPFGIFVPFALDEATANAPGQAVALGKHC